MKNEQRAIPFRPSLNWDSWVILFHLYYLNGLFTPGVVGPARRAEDGFDSMILELLCQCFFDG